MNDSGLIAIISVFAFAFGASIASFLNVVIWRVPRGESIVSPPSHCPKCGSPIRWYQNLPILSWLALRGRCANCRAPISPRYIFVETLGGLLFLAVFLRFGIGVPPVLAVPTVAVFWIWTALMLAGAFIDYDHQLLPDFTTVGGMVLGLLYGGVLSWIFRSWLELAGSAIGLAFGFGLFWLIRFLGSKVFRREAMGLGDVFLMGAVGAISGPVAVFFTMLVSSLLGALGGLFLVLLRKTRLGGFTAIPYGPYICLAHLVFIFFGNELVGWYLKLISGH